MKRFWNMLDVEPEETGPVGLLLAISFFMGLFMATIAVASQTLFLNFYSEKDDLPVAIFYSGVFGIIATLLYNFLQGKVAFKTLAVFNLVLVMALTATIEFGEFFVTDVNQLYRFGFMLVLPFTFITQLVFWGAFARMFNVRVAKRLVGSVDIGTTIAQILAFFAVPVILAAGVPVTSLFIIGLGSIVVFLILFIRLSNQYLTQEKLVVKSEKEIKKLSFGQFFGNKYIITMSMFIIISTIALRFVDYSFFNISTVQFDNESLPYFLSFFEATVVIFSFLFTTFVTDYINQNYGLKVSLLINPLLLILFTVAALGLGFFFGYDPLVTGQSSVIYFFIAIAMGKLLLNSLKDAIDNPTFKFYYVPIDKEIKIDAQTKIEGIVMALASTVAGGLIVLINSVDIFNLLTVTAFTIPVLVIWYWVTSRMYVGYRHTLQSSLIKNKSAIEKDVVREYTMDSVLEKEVRSTAEEKVVYGLKLMEKLEPALFESSLLQLADSKIKKVRQFATDKIQELGLVAENNEIKGLASQALGASEDSDFLSISVDKLMKLCKSPKQADRILGAKLLRKITNQKTIFILLELLRDADSKVRSEALLTARKVKRPETWGVLIDLLSSPIFSHQASSALKEAGEPVLPYLETAFHKSGQTELVMLKLIQITGHIGGQEGMKLLWKKIDYPDKRIVRQILYSLRLINYRARGRETLDVKELLDVEMSKTLWNLAALDELPDQEYFLLVKDALREEILENYEHLTLLLSLLYEPESVQLVKTNVELGSPDSIQYALELLDLFVEQDLKPKLIPLLDDSSVKDKLEKLQTYFPRETYNPIQTINYILNRDFNYNNRWTKVCATHSTAYIPDFRVSRGLISQMFNRDKLLQETAAWVVFNKDIAAYQTVSARLPYKDKKYIDSAIENNQLLDGLDDGFFLGIEMVMLIKKLPIFKNISGRILSDLADKINPITLNDRDKLVIQPGENPILIQAFGDVTLKNNNEVVQVLKQGNVFGDLFQEGPTPAVTEAEATGRAVIFKINLIDFYFVMAIHHDLAQGLIENITESKELVN